MTEQRNYQRINFRTEADISTEDSVYRCDLVDLALQGALFKSERELPLLLGTHTALSIYLPDSSVRMEFTGELIHQRGKFYGFIFTSEDTESMGHLRRLLELNFGDANQADEEFSHWLKRGSVA
ncbi:MAG: PilZ domain-containing protein [Desulfuromusa sp.]|nr:PilZ domain-containing protein [Desulfuromusa sp.]